MNVKQLKIHVMRGLIRPEYFRIPLLGKTSGTMPIRFKIVDEFGDDVFVSQISLYYQIYSFSHDTNQYDEYSKGYTFNKDFDWRYPVPDPSEYEIYPIPDFGSIDVLVKNGTVTKSGTSLTFIFENPQTLIEIENLPAGVYSVNAYPVPSYINNVKYYPNYFDDYYNIPPGVDIDTLPSFNPNIEWHTGDYIKNNGKVFVIQYDYHPGDPVSSDLFVQYNKDRQPYDTSNGLIDRKGKFSGFYYQSVYENSQQVGYNFYGITKKFDDNTMPIVMYYRTWQLIINKTTEYGKRLKNIKFKLHSESGDFTSSYPQLLYASVISRNSTDIVFTTTSDRYATFVRYLPVNKNYTLTELEIPENFTGYSGDIGFHFQKTGELVCNIQNEYVSNTTDSITVKNKRVNHRVKMVITIVDNPLLSGGYWEKYTGTQLVEHEITNPYGYFGHQWEYDPSDIPDGYITSTNYVNLINSIRQEKLEERLGNKASIAKLYLDGEYKGFYTYIELTKDNAPYSESTDDSAYAYSDSSYANNWYSIGGENKSKYVRGSYTAWCLTKPSYWDEHAFDEESHSAAYFQADGYEKINYGVNSGISDPWHSKTINSGLWTRYEYIVEDPVESQYVANYTRHTLETAEYDLVSASVEYEGGTSAYLNMTTKLIRDYKDYYDSSKNTHSVTDPINNSHSFDLGSIAADIEYAETHDLIYIQPDIIYEDGRKVLGYTTTKYYGEGLTSEVTYQMYQIAQEEDMEVEFEN